MKRALITGLTGQDGSYLAEFLLELGYEIFGLVRRESWSRPNNASHLADRLNVIFGDITDMDDVTSALKISKPDEIYNLASQSRPGESWIRGLETLKVNGMGAIMLFEGVRQLCPNTRIYHASSSDMYGQTTSISQNEETPFNPANPYAAVKVYSHHMAQIYRKSYGMFISCGILFNHESERRPIHFVTQKIAYGAACAALGIKRSSELNELGNPIVADGQLTLGNLNVSRDWGDASDFVRAMWLIVQQDLAEDFVVGTEQLHTLRQLCQVAYNRVGLNWQNHVVTDPSLERPLETSQTLADASKARRLLKWSANVSFDEMVSKMVDAQILRLKLTV